MSLPSQPLLPPILSMQQVVKDLKLVRQRWRKEQYATHELSMHELPSQKALAEIFDELRSALFPLRLGPAHLQQQGEDYFVGYTLDKLQHSLLEQVRLDLYFQGRTASALPELALEAKALQIVHAFFSGLPQIRELLDSDVLAAYHGDPAATSVDEVLLCYPSIEASTGHRLAHSLYQLGAPLLAKLLAGIVHTRTGIDIHPGAQIGHSFFIDHGTGVVIGETAIIGNRVRLYQAITLGARNFPHDENGHTIKGLARHPIIEDDVVIYAGATVLGRITVGRGASIGGNV